MDFLMNTAEIFVPDDLDSDQALARTTHMSIAAHHDDIEVLALDGILACFQTVDKWFCGVVVTNGSGSPRAGVYSDYSDDQMRAVRRVEQLKAATVGEYGAQVLLDYSSAAVKDSTFKAPVEDFVRLLKAARPAVVYTHNLADKHDTHVGVTLKVIEAVRSLPPAERPERLYGCEVWRDLDWMVNADKVVFDSSTQQNLQAALLGVFDSQISGGKRYDLATMGRRRANATYYESHATDATTGSIYAMDLTPLMQDADLDIHTYAQSFIQRFASDVTDRITRMGCVRGET